MESSSWNKYGFLKCFCYDQCYNQDVIIDLTVGVRHEVNTQGTKHFIVTEETNISRQEG